jgi:CubicO group peptidase (beta-lactamase class C family)
VTRNQARTRAVLEAAIGRRVFPGAVLEVGSSGTIDATIAVGHLAYDDDATPVTETTVYDLASLTKVLCTTMLAARLVQARRIRVDDPVGMWCDAWTGEDRGAVTLRHLLLHASGLPAHRRYFEQLRGGAAFEAAIAGETLEYVPGSRSVYSDPGFILLGRILARAGGASLDEQFYAWWRATWYTAPTIAFNPPPPWRARIAPTEIDPWRGRLLRGEVHDENAAALDGVAGHAGLFGTAAGVGTCARWWLTQIDRQPWATFVTRGAVPDSSRALGWDTMLPTSSCGTRMSTGSFGHTGFTGTSLWVDPVRDRYVVLLSNRVHPTRAGDGMRAVRSAAHDAVAADLDDASR